MLKKPTLLIILLIISALGCQLVTDLVGEETATATPLSAQVTPAEEAVEGTPATETPDSVELPTETSLLAQTPQAEATVAAATETPVRMDSRATAQALTELMTLSTSTPTPEGRVTPSSEYVAVFNQAWDTIHENYVRGNFNGVDWDAVYEEYLPLVEAVPDQEAFWQIMDDFVAELNDEHSRFVAPNDFGAEFNIPELLQAGRPHPGLLIQPSREDEYLFVWDVCSTSPAARAGIEKGDVILAINDEEVVNTEDGFDLTAYREALLNDDSIKFTIQQGPDQEPEPFTVNFGGVGGCPGWVRGILSESPRVGYIRIPNFGGESNTVLFELIQELEEDAPLEGLIVDVRHNPGGNSDRDIALFTTGVFGTTGKLREGATQVIYRIRGPVGWNETTPVVVLTDGSSHSAAEYFATAMQQSGRATIVGMPTAGNTEGITGFSLPDGSVIRLAVMILTLPDGSQLEDIGVQPDISVPNGMWGMKERIQLQVAYDTLLQQIE